MEQVNDSGDTPLHRAVHDANMPMCEYLVSRGADPMAENNFKQTPLDLIGENRDDNPPYHPTAPPLTAAQKQEHADRLKLQRREVIWQRRKHWVMFLVGCEFLPLLNKVLEQRLEQMSLDKSVPIAADPTETEEQRRALKQRKVFGNEGIMRNVAGFL